MENRFGVRDLVQAVLLLAVIVLIGVSMFQVDRQWKVMQQLKRDVTQQSQDTAQIARAFQAQAANPQILQLQDELKRLRETLEKGVVVAGMTGGTLAQGQDPSQAQQQETYDAAAEEGKIKWGPVVGEDVDPFANIKAAQSQPGYAASDFLVDVFAVMPDKLTPLISSDTYSSIIQDHILESLAKRDADTLQWQPLLAKWWRVSEDGLNIEFEMRTNATFSDGRPVRPRDVVFTFEWMMNPEVETPRTRAYYEKVESVKQVGPHRVRFTFKEPYFKAFELAGGMDVLPEHFYREHAPTPTSFNTSTGLLMGSGPYRLADPAGWKPEPGKPIEIVRNERYWGPRPPYPKILWRVIKQDTTRLTAFRNGEIDRMFTTPEQYRKMLEDEALVARTQHYEMQQPTAGYRFVAWAQKKDGQDTIFTDVRVRRAMTMMIDRERICREIMYGYATPVSGPFSILSPQSNEAIKPWPYDVEKAKALLAEAGFVDRNGDGVVDAPDGRPLRVKISYPANSETFNRMILLMKDSFARAGVMLEEDPLEWNVLLQRITNKQLEAYSLGWSGSIESDPYQIFHSSMIAGTGDNTISYSNPQLDALMEKARVTVDDARRMPLWHQVHEILHQDQPYTFLFTGKSLQFMDKRFRNVKQVRTGLNSTFEWYVPQDEVKWGR